MFKSQLRSGIYSGGRSPSLKKYNTKIVTVLQALYRSYALFLPYFFFPLKP